MSSKGQGSASGMAGQEDFEGMMERLGLYEEDLDDVVFEEKDQLPAEATPWMAVAQDHMELQFGQF